MMKMHATAAVLLGLSAVAGAARADNIDVNLSDKAVRGTYSLDLTGTQGLSMDAGLFYNDDDELVGNVGAMVSGQNWSQSGTFDIKLGGQAIIADADPGTAYALALGGQVRYTPVARVGISGHVFFAPKIITWGDGERYNEYGVRLDYQLLPQAFVYIGYRKISTKFDNGDTLDFDKDGHIGMQFFF